MTICWSEEIGKLLKRDLTPEEAFEWLIDQYVNHKVSADELGRRLKVSGRSVLTILETFKIDRRPKGGARHCVSCDITEEEFKTMSYTELARKYKVSYGTVYTRCKRFKKKKEKTSWPKEMV